MEIAANARNACGQVNENLNSYLLGEDGLLLRYIPKIDEGEVNNLLSSSRFLGYRLIGYFHDFEQTNYSSGSKAVMS